MTIRLYHTTTADCADSIMVNGFRDNALKNKRIFYTRPSPGVWFSDVPELDDKLFDDNGWFDFNAESQAFIAVDVPHLPFPGIQSSTVDWTWPGTQYWAPASTWNRFPKKHLQLDDVIRLRLGSDPELRRLMRKRVSKPRDYHTEFFTRVKRVLVEQKNDDVAQEQNPSWMITLDVMGIRERVPFKGTAEQYAKLIAGERKFVALKRRCLKQAAQCVTGADKIQAVDNYMLMLGSHERIAALLPLIEREPPEIFWSIFVRWWSDCDCIWRWNARLVKILQRVGPCRHYKIYGRNRWMDKFFESLPDRLTVYRGASRSRIKGALSWTTDIDIARNFAYGHRGIAVPDAVIATGTVRKDEIFLASDDGGRREILALPRIVKVRDFSAAEFARIKQARADAKWADEAADEHAKAQARFDEDDALQLLEY